MQDSLKQSLQNENVYKILNFKSIIVITTILLTNNQDSAE